ncbi:hypothetical protein HDU76_003963 [Blyttiomyces sp. JEL0837]|nr:hypothetical protein HDU76_003963 [Blyttiomyces sp. JEL0837]
MSLNITVTTSTTATPLIRLSNLLSGIILSPIFLTAQYMEEGLGHISPTTSVTWFLLALSRCIIVRSRLLLVENGTIGLNDFVVVADVVGVLLTIVAVGVHFTTAPRDDEYTPVAESEVSSSLHLQPTPKVSMYSVLTFGFMGELMKEGTTRSITKDDLWELPTEFQARRLFNVFENAYKKLMNDSGSLIPFFRSLIPLFGVEYLIAFSFLTVSLFLDLIQPSLIDGILAYIGDTSVPHKYPASYGWTLVALMTVVAISSPPVKEQYFHRMLVTGAKIRTGLVGAIYRKSLRLSSAARQRYSQGQIQTLQSVDAEVIQGMGRQIFQGLRAPVQLVIVFYLLHQQLGFAFVPGVLVLIASTPLQVTLTRQSGNFEKSRLQAMDKRIKWLGEAIKGILVVKFNTWEEPMLTTIKDLRQEEVNNIQKSLLYQALAFTVWQLQPYLIAIACFGTYVFVMNQTLTPQRVFVSLALLRLMNPPINWLRNLFMLFTKIWVSARRIDTFLKAEEVDRGVEKFMRDSGDGYLRREWFVDGDERETGKVVEVEGASFAWSREREDGDDGQGENQGGDERIF